MSKKVVVTGDVCVDWISIPIQGKGANDDGTRPKDTPNWKIHDSSRTIAREGGALLLRQMVDAAIRGEGATAQVVGPKVTDLETKPSTEIVHSMFAAKLVKHKPDSKKKDPKKWRVERFAGAYGPDDTKSLNAFYKQCSAEGMDDADVVVIDDAGNGFRDGDEDCTPALKDASKRPWVVLKVAQPLAKGKPWNVMSALWKRLIKDHKDRLITIVDAKDIREEGTQISEGISWERSATDTLAHLMTNESLKELCKSKHLIIRFGCEGALHHWRQKDGWTTTLHFVPSQIEGATKNSYPGLMTGMGAAFAAAIAKHIALHPAAAEADASIEPVADKKLSEQNWGIKEGLRRSQALFESGFEPHKSKQHELDYPCEALFKTPWNAKGAPDVAVVSIGLDALSSVTGAGLWSIAAEQLSDRAIESAREVVIKGSSDSLVGAPIGAFAALETVDRGEIESYRTIRNLITEYKNDPNPKRPLCIAVFGPPGAGKSFGVKQVASSMDDGNISSDGVVFNVSQFESPNDLVRALNRVRDSVLEGKLPLVFFDEFDSSVGSEELAWIKYFLMPMQDGEFRDGEVVHPIGKCIFVFAGGVFDSLESLSKGIIRLNDDDPGDDRGTTVQLQPEQIKNAKVPDFVSRLRGYVDVTGPNPFHPYADRLFQIRRALLLRSLLERKRPNLMVPGGKTLQINPHLVDALIHVPKFKHGARSVEAIIDMSYTTGRRRFDQSALPPAEQLELHVDSEVFLDLVEMVPALEEMAEAVHNAYLGSEQPSEEAGTAWSTLDPGYQESSRRQVLDIPIKLKRVGIGIVRTDRPTNFDGFSDEEVEQLAPLEHVRWSNERIQSGWRYGPVRDNVRKIHPLLIPWEELSDPKKDLDRIAVRSIPDVLALGGLKLVRKVSRD